MRRRMRDGDGGCDAATRGHCYKKNQDSKHVPLAILRLRVDEKPDTRRMRRERGLVIALDRPLRCETRHGAKGG